MAHLQFALFFQACHTPETKKDIISTTYQCQSELSSHLPANPARKILHRAPEVGPCGWSVLVQPSRAAPITIAVAAVTSAAAAAVRGPRTIAVPVASLSAALAAVAPAIAVAPMRSALGDLNGDSETQNKGANSSLTTSIPPALLLTDLP